MATILDGDGYRAQFEQFHRLFRWEPRRSYLSERQRDAFEARLLPPQVDWWRDELARMTRWTSPPPQGDGRTVERVRLDDPEDSDYQAWLRPADPYHRQAGEDLRRLPRSRAAELGLPGYDFLVFDDGPAARAVILLYDEAGRQAQRILIGHADSPDLVEQHSAWRDLAINHATAAVTAAA